MDTGCRRYDGSFLLIDARIVPTHVFRRMTRSAVGRRIHLRISVSFVLFFVSSACFLLAVVNSTELSLPGHWVPRAYHDERRNGGRSSAPRERR
jgi:hypothetical protein